MKKKMFSELERQEGLSDFEAFKEFVSKLLHVPKKAIDEHEEEFKKVQEKLNKRQRSPKYNTKN